MQRLLIVQNSDDLIASLVALLNNRFCITTCTDGVTALQHLRNNRFDAMILDLMLPEKEGLCVLEEAGTDAPPIVLATTFFFNYYIREQLYALGVAHVMRLPCDPSTIANRLGSILESNMVLSQPSLYRTLQNLGFSCKRDGYKQLLAGIPMYARDSGQTLSKELYPAIAKECGFDNGRQVEHSIRCAIEDAYKHGSSDAWEHYFPNYAHGKHKIPSNKDFIARMTQIISGNE